MEFEERLTKEHIGKKFETGSQFDWVNVAIGLARHAIHSGKEPIGNVDTDNISVNILFQLSGKKTPEEILEEINTAEVQKAVAPSEIIDAENN